MESSDELSKKDLAHLAAILAERKQRLLGEIRQTLASAGADQRYDQVVGAAGDAGDESVAILLRDLANAEVARDVREVRDIMAAEERMANGKYGYCVDCGGFIGLARLEAYASAKRCIRCQEVREKTRASTPHPTL